MRWLLAGLALLALPPTQAQEAAPSTLRVVGSTPPWVAGARFEALPPDAALGELLNGRADAVLGTLPLPKPPNGTGLVGIPVGVFPVSVVYSLPGVNVRLDVPTLCQMLAGRILMWNHAWGRALNPDATLPALPVLVSARVARNGVSLAVAGACVKAGAWPPAWLKSNWVAGASFSWAALGSQRRDLNVPGVLMVLGPRDVPAGAQVALLRSPDGAFVPPSTPPDVPGLPVWPFAPLPPARAAGTYPLRGVVWLTARREQGERSRAQVLLALATRLQSGSGGGFSGLPPTFRPRLPLTYRGEPLESAPRPASSSSP